LVDECLHSGGHFYLNLFGRTDVGNKSSESWGYVVAIIVLALLFVLILPVIGIMYMDIHQERILISNDLKRIEKLKKELEAQKEK
jgi:F0F1-type ATP synthase membrane subunit b/b'